MCCILVPSEFWSAVLNWNFPSWYWTTNMNLYVFPLGKAGSHRADLSCKDTQVLIITYVSDCLLVFFSAAVFNYVLNTADFHSKWSTASLGGTYRNFSLCSCFTTRISAKFVWSCLSPKASTLMPLPKLKSLVRWEEKYIFVQWHICSDIICFMEECLLVHPVHLYP